MYLRNVECDTLNVCRVFTERKLLRGFGLLLQIARTLRVLISLNVPYT
jgi:hypothetical protein